MRKKIFLFLHLFIISWMMAFNASSQTTIASYSVRINGAIGGVTILQNGILYQKNFCAPGINPTTNFVHPE